MVPRGGSRGGDVGSSRGGEPGWGTRVGMLCFWCIFSYILQSKVEGNIERISCDAIDQLRLHIYIF